METVYSSIPTLIETFQEKMILFFRLPAVGFHTNCPILQPYNNLKIFHIYNQHNIQYNGQT